MGNKNKIIVNLVALLIILLPSFALAHNVSILAYEEQGRVYCESFYQDGKPVTEGDYTVKTKDGTIIVAGKTSSNGLFQFPYQGGEALTITLKTLMGHSNSIVFDGQSKRETTVAGQVYSKPGLSKVLLGICVIFILFGVVAYLMSKKSAD